MDDSDGSEVDHGHAAILRWLARTAPGEVRLCCGHGPATARASEPVVRVAGCVADLPAYRIVDLLIVTRTVTVSTAGCARLAGGGTGGVRAAGAMGDVGAEGAAGAMGDLGAPSDLGDWLGRLPATVRARVRVDHVTTPAATTVDVLRPPVDRRGLVGLVRQGATRVPSHEAGDDAYARLVTSLTTLGVDPATSDPSPLGVDPAPSDPSPLGADPATPNPPGSAPLASALLADGCIACGVCVKACPHDALALTADPIAVLAHDRGLCRGEGACVEHCPESAIAASGPVTWLAVTTERTVPLAEVPTRVCAKCRTRFGGPIADELCPLCRFRRAEPFGSTLPPKAAELLRRRREGRQQPGR